MFHTRLIASFAAASAVGLTVSMASGQSLVAEYLFNGNLADSSGHVDLLANPAPTGIFKEGTTATGSVVSTPTYVGGIDGTTSGALLLDGVDDWVDFGLTGLPFYAQSNQKGVAAGTVVAWVKTSDPGNQYLMGTQNTGSSQNFTAGNLGGSLDIYPRASNGGFFHLKETDGLGASMVGPNWHMVVWAWDVDVDNAANGGPDKWYAPTESSVWLDNVKSTSYGADWVSLDSSDPQIAWEFPMAVGARDNRGVIQDNWQGALDSLQVYDYMLSDAEILALYNAMAPYIQDLSGDINGDGFVGLADLDIVLSTWNNGVPPSSGTPSIPEPASLTLLAAGGLALLRRR